MESLIIKPGDYTPSVSFDPTAALFEISGDSRPERVKAFYKPLIEWLQHYKQTLVDSQSNHTNRNLVLKLRVNYFNSASTKFLLDILLIFTSIRTVGYGIEVIWYYDDEDEEIYEAGVELSELTKFPFTYVPFKS